MGSLNQFHSQLKNLQSQAKKLTESGLALNALFDQEEIRLKREDEASRLRAVYRAVVEQSQRLEGTEASVEYGHSQGNLILSLGGAVLAAMGAKSEQLSAIADHLLNTSGDEQQPFGLVMVRIGPNGLPDDVRAVSISQLARESGRPQPEIINKLREDSYLPLSQEAFSALIDKLIGDVREGRLNLPISREKLGEIAGKNRPKCRIKIVPIE